jgi:sugar lactone lactonase YvrE
VPITRQEDMQAGPSCSRANPDHPGLRSSPTATFDLVLLHFGKETQMTRQITLLGTIFVALAALCAVPSPTRAQATGYLLVADYDSARVLRYSAATGELLDEFVPKHSAGLNQPQGMVFGPHDHDLYVGSGHFAGPGQLKAILRFDGETGGFKQQFVGPDQLNRVHAVTFGPDGNLYVGDWFGPQNKDQPDGVGRSRILRFSGITGEFIDEFVPTSSGGLRHPAAHVFGPDGNLYVSDEGTSRVLRYNGATGAFMDVFASRAGAGLFALTFGPGSAAPNSS